MTEKPKPNYSGYYLVSFPLFIGIIAGLSGSPLAVYFISFSVAVLAFLICRKFVLWYYRIDERIFLQNETIRLLKKIAGEPEDPIKQSEQIEPEKEDTRTDEQKIEDFNRRLYGS